MEAGMSRNPSKQIGPVRTKRDFYCDPNSPGYKLVKRMALEILDKELAARRFAVDVKTLALEILDEALAAEKAKA
jgi:hypothetical protein